jgi:hypothetical protein
MQLRHARLVDSERRADVFHRDLAVVVHRNHALFAGWQRANRLANAIAHFVALELHIWTLRLGGDHDRGQVRFVNTLDRREGGGRFNGVQANDRLAEAGFVGSDGLREIGE